MPAALHGCGTPQHPVYPFASMQPHRLFVLLILITGLLAMALTPPFQGADEFAHLCRAYALADGQMSGELHGKTIGFVIPEVVIRDGLSMDHLPFHPEVRTSLAEWGAKYDASSPWTAANLSTTRFARCQFACYPPVPHLPQALAARIGRVLELRTFSVLYLGRLLNLLSGCALLLAAFWMLRDCPRLQLAAFAVAAMPMSVFSYASLNADGVTISLAVLVFAWAVYLGSHWSVRGFAGYAIAGALLGLSKVAYVLIPATIVPVLWSAGVPVAVRARRVAFLALVVLLPTLLWTISVRDLANHANAYGELAQSNADTQIATLKAQPFQVVASWVTYTQRELSHITSTFVGNFGWGETYLPINLALGYLAAMAAVSLVGTGNSDQTRPRAQIATDTLIGAAGVFGVYLIAFVSFGTKQITMIAGRYFIPFALPLLACIPVVATVRERALVPWRVLLVLAWIVFWGNVLAMLAGRYWSELGA